MSRLLGPAVVRARILPAVLFGAALVNMACNTNCGDVVRPTRLFTAWADPVQGTVPLTVNFTANPTGCDACYVSWSFSDTPQTQIGYQVVHTYTTPGTWAWSASLQENGQQRTEAHGVVTVQPAPGPR